MSNAERVARYHKKMAEKGYKRVTIMIAPDHIKFVESFAKKYDASQSEVIRYMIDEFRLNNSDDQKGTLLDRIGSLFAVFKNK